MTDEHQPEDLVFTGIDARRVLIPDVPSLIEAVINLAEALNAVVARFSIEEEE